MSPRANNWLHNDGRDPYICVTTDAVRPEASREALPYSIPVIGFRPRTRHGRTVRFDASSVGLAQTSHQCTGEAVPRRTERDQRSLDRKSVVQDKSVSVRVYLGGRCIFNKQKNTCNYNLQH